MKVLNLYCGGGGNRKLWDDVEVTAIEHDPEIAKVYQGFFPDDEVIVTDAHQFLLDNFKDYDFILSSPPCPTHSITNNYLHVQGVIRYPDMKLYEEIVFLKQFHKGYFCVENVKSYYVPLITPVEIDRHYFWANFHITPFTTPKRDFNITNARIVSRVPNKKYSKKLAEFHGFPWCEELGNDFQILVFKNMVYPPLGKHILDCAKGNTVKPLTEFMEARVRE